MHMLVLIGKFVHNDRRQSGREFVSFLVKQKITRVSTKLVKIKIILSKFSETPILAACTQYQTCNAFVQ